MLDNLTLFLIGIISIIIVTTVADQYLNRLERRRSIIPARIIYFYEGKALPTLDYFEMTKDGEIIVRIDVEGAIKCIEQMSPEDNYLPAKHYYWHPEESEEPAEIQWRDIR